MVHIGNIYRILTKLIKGVLKAKVISNSFFNSATNSYENSFNFVAIHLIHFFKPQRF